MSFAAAGDFPALRQLTSTLGFDVNQADCAWHTPTHTHAAALQTHTRPAPLFVCEYDVRVFDVHCSHRARVTSHDAHREKIDAVVVPLLPVCAMC
eukprot:934842-Prymnesium_polylepis.2